MKPLFDKVLYIGPDIDEPGGMAAVLRAYRSMLPSFHYLQTNSRHGTIRGAARLLATLLCMPIERLRGRKLLHVHGASGKSFVRKSLVIRWGRLLGYKAIFHCHGGGIRDYFDHIGVDKARRTLDSCDAIIVLSEYWRQYFSTTFPGSSVSVLNNVVVPIERTRRKADGKLRLLFLGTINDGKGIFDLVDTIAANRDRWHGRLELIIGGKGDDARLRKAIADGGIADMVDFRGIISGEAKNAAFAQADIAILPSYVEALPIFLMEAMACGMPVISTPVGGIPELVGDRSGILVTPGDRAALAAAIDSYLSDPTLVQTHGARALDRIKPYLPATVTSRLAEIYEAMM